MATDGTKMVVEALDIEDEVISHCVVGEPTSSETFGDMIKVGRRGSINAEIAVYGVQGHVAYPQRATNPVPVLLRLLLRLQERVLDTGYPQFQPSNLEITKIDAPNEATNVIPGAAYARVNIRFNPSHSGADLARWIEAEAFEVSRTFGCRVEVTPQISGEPFLTEPGAFTEVVAAAVKDATGHRPELSTSGGTSDARASSARSVRWSSWAWWARPCTGSTKARRSPRSCSSRWSTNG